MMSNEEKILAMLVELKESTDKRFDAIDKRFDAIDKRFDAIDKRLDAVEERLDCLDTRSQRTAVLMEADIAPKIQLLYEGHESIMEYLDKLTPKSRVEMLESEVGLIKHALKHMQQEITELKKAQ